MCEDCDAINSPTESERQEWINGKLIHCKMVLDAAGFYAWSGDGVIYTPCNCKVCETRGKQFTNPRWLPDVLKVERSH